MENEWQLKIHKDVKKKHLPLLESANLMSDYEDIKEILRRNPYSRERNQEKLNPKNKEIYSMRINGKHRVVYTIDKKRKLVKIWSAWTHYERNIR